MDTIFWLSPSIESCNWIDFISVAYASWYHWNCGRTQRKAATINQFACPSYSLYVQLLWYPMYYPGGMKARVNPVQWSKPHSILAPTQDSNPGIVTKKIWIYYPEVLPDKLLERWVESRSLKSFQLVIPRRNLSWHVQIKPDIISWYKKFNAINQVLSDPF